MLNEICAEIRNYFPTEKRYGNFTIKNGSISPVDFLQEGQYFRIVGSVFNDGVHQHPASDLNDESFNGSVWAMAVPPALIDLSEEIKTYADIVDANPSPFTSESFGGYSYTKATDVDGVAMSWQKAYGKRLNKWRRVAE